MTSNKQKASARSNLVKTGCTIAGGALLSIIPDTDAAIQYSSQDLTFNVAGGRTNSFDINSDGRMDIAFGMASNAGKFGGYVQPRFSNGGFIRTAVNVPSNVAKSGSISAGRDWQNTGSGFMFYGNGTYAATWARNFTSGNVGPNAGYIGLRLSLDASNVRYAWVHVDSVASDFSSFHVSGWAYEDTGAAIQAGDGESGGGGAVPEPTGLALLACGAAGILALRRKTLPKSEG